MGGTGKRVTTNSSRATPTTNENTSNTRMYRSPTSDSSVPASAGTYIQTVTKKKRQSYYIIYNEL